MGKEVELVRQRQLRSRFECSSPRALHETHTRWESKTTEKVVRAGSLAGVPVDAG